MKADTCLGDSYHRVFHRVYIQPTRCKGNGSGIHDICCHQVEDVVRI